MIKRRRKKRKYFVLEVKTKLHLQMNRQVAVELLDFFPIRQSNYLYEDMAKILIIETVTEQREYKQLFPVRTKTISI